MGAVSRDEVVGLPTGKATITVERGSTSWELTWGRSRHSGTSFATLAELARALAATQNRTDESNPVRAANLRN